MDRASNAKDAPRRAPLPDDGRQTTRSFPPLSVTGEALLVDGSDQEFRALVDDLVALSVQIQAMRQAIARRMGVSSPEYNLLRTIAERGDDEDQGIGTLARRLGVKEPFVVAQTARLVEAGLVEKTAHPSDRRRVRVRLTAIGRSLFEHAAPFLRRVNDAAFDSLTHEDFHLLRRLAEKLSGSFDRANRMIQEEQDAAAETAS